MTIWGIFQIILTFLEVAVCFGVCDALIYKKEFIKEHWIYTLLCVLVITYLIVINREVVFYSHLVFLTEIFLIWGCLYFKGRKKGILSFVLILDYNLVVMLLDFAFAFSAISYLNENFWDIIYYQVGGGKILIYFLARSILTFSSFVLLRHVERMRFDIENYKGLLWGVGIIGIIWGWWFSTTLIDHGSESNLWDSFFIITCLVILTAFMAVKLKNTHLEAQSQIMQMENELLEQNYDSFQRLYENNRYIYHDFKNHMILLQTYLEHGEYEEARNYLGRIAAPIEQISNCAYSNCKVLDLVINLKGFEASQKDILYQLDVDKEVVFNIDENDLGILLFNLLDNAIEACERMKTKERWIRIVVKRKNQILVIKIVNSIEKEVFKKDGRYLTEKKDKEMHGLGMKSVESIVEKYEGDVSWNHTKDTFTAVITFFKNELQ